MLTCEHGIVFEEIIFCPIHDTQLEHKVYGCVLCGLEKGTPSIACRKCKPDLMFGLREILMGKIV